MTFQQFLTEFVPLIQEKSKQVNLATWILETTGSEDAASLKASLDIELRLFFNDKKTFEKLIAWDQENQDPLLKRQLNVLIRAFKPQQIDKELIYTIAQEEANLSLLYSNFRPIIGGEKVSENDIRTLLKTENDVNKRKAAWEASKEIGKILAPHIIKLVHLRNQAAKSLGYSNYFSMQLMLQEVDEDQLFKTLDKLALDSEDAYLKVLNEINEAASKRFNVPVNDIGPWCFAEPFCQEDPLDAKELDQVASSLDIIEAARNFYASMGLDVNAILAKSDQYERPGKNQHAFCISIDRDQDIRTLNNVKPTIKWLETMLHELGHAVYDQGYAKDIPWLLREPPHMIPTEAMALLAGRQAYRQASLDHLSPGCSPTLKELAETSLKRRQLIFSRFVLVMTYFERELYHNPDQDLNALWWKIVEKYQKIVSSGSQHKQDWAAKYHIGAAPAYYFSYLLGELFASTLEENIQSFPSKKTGDYLSHLFAPANLFHWNTLIKQITGDELNSKAWIRQFAS